MGMELRLWMIQRDIERRIAAVRRAKVAKLTDPRNLSGEHRLSPEELDEALGYVSPPPATHRTCWDKTPILPCVSCGDPEGRKGKGCNVPGRTSGSPYGFDGEICLRCSSALESRRRRALVRLGIPVVIPRTPPVIHPCVSCGERGKVLKGCKYPYRMPGDKYGFSGEICANCRDRFEARARRAAASRAKSTFQESRAYE